jgi:hypothetical protein
VAAGSCDVALLCSSRFYTTGQTATNRTGQSQCEPGYYCVDGVRTSCPAGTYGSGFGLTTSACTGSCTAGYYCAAGSTSATQTACGYGKTFPAAWYCPTGSGSPTAVSSGYYTTPTSASTSVRTGQVKCDASAYCTNGVQMAYLSWTSCPSSVTVSENVASVYVTGNSISAISSTTPKQTVSMNLDGNPWDFSKKMIGLYELEKNFNDSTPYAYTAKGMGTYSFSSTIVKIGTYSLSLSGTGHMAIPSIKLSSAAGGVLFWYRPSVSSSTNQGVLELENRCGSSYSLYLHIKDAVLYLQMGSRTLGKVSLASTTYTQNSWSQYALTYNTSSSSVDLYIDSTSYIVGNTSES